MHVDVDRPKCPYYSFLYPLFRGSVGLREYFESMCLHYTFPPSDQTVYVLNVLVLRTAQVNQILQVVLDVLRDIVEGTSYADEISVLL